VLHYWSICISFYIIVFERPKKKCSTQALTRDPAVLWRLFSIDNHCKYISINFISPETKVPILYDSCYIVGLSVYVFIFTQLFSKATKRCSRRAVTRDPTVLWRLFSKESARMCTQTLCCYVILTFVYAVPLFLQINVCYFVSLFL